jgi:hypothetical protein
MAAAMQDFVDATNPTDGNDWLTLSRAAQAVDHTLRRLRRVGDPPTVRSSPNRTER